MSFNMMFYHTERALACFLYLLQSAFADVFIQFFHDVFVVRPATAGLDVRERVFVRDVRQEVVHGGRFFHLAVFLVSVGEEGYLSVDTSIVQPITMDEWSRE